MTDQKEKFVYTCCPGWGDHEYCAIKTIVKDGKIVRTEKPDYTGPEACEGYICQKGITSGRHPYLPGRLLHPLKRAGERGSGKWEQISGIRRWTRSAQSCWKSAPNTDPNRCACGTWQPATHLQTGLNTQLATRFLNLWGATDPIQAYGLDNGGMFVSYYELGSTFGYMSTDPSTMDHSELIVVWGANPVENQHRIAKHLAAAQDREVRVIDIGLVFDATAGKSDWFIPVRPGSDAALALSMAYLIVENKLYDEEFLLKYTVAPFLVRDDDGQFVRDESGNYVAWDQQAKGPVSIEPKAENFPMTLALKGKYSVGGVTCKPAFALLKKHLKKYTPKKQADITGVDPETVYALTAEYASTKPALMLGALGMRYQNQGESYRALLLLSTLTGNIGVFGGGATCELMPTGYPIVFNDFPIFFPRKVWRATRRNMCARTISSSRLSPVSPIPSRHSSKPTATRCTTARTARAGSMIPSRRWSWWSNLTSG